MQVITARKNAKDARLGVSLERTSDGRVLVIRVADKGEGVFADTGLQVGMELVLVNDKPCQGDLTAATNALRSAPLGVLRLHVIAPTTPLSASSSEEKNTEASTTNKDDATDNARSRTRSSRNDQTINSPGQHRTEEDIVAPGAVEVRYESPSRIRKSRSSKQKNKQQNMDKLQRESLKKGRSQVPVGPTHTVVVPHVGHLGIRLQDVEEGQGVQVGRVDKDSVLADTEFRVGMRLLAVNGTACTSVSQVAQVLRQPSDGLLTLVVQQMEAATADVPDDLSGRFSQYKNVRQSQLNGQKRSSHLPLLTATVHKTRRSTATGIRLKEAPNRQSVRIDRIADDSLFVGTALEVGQTLVKVNDLSTTKQTTIQEVATWIRETKGVLALTVLPSSSNFSEETENIVPPAPVKEKNKKKSKSKEGKTESKDKKGIDGEEKLLKNEAQKALKKKSKEKKASASLPSEF